MVNNILSISDPFPRNMTEVLNTSVKNAKSTTRNKDPMLPETRDMLDHFFAFYNKKLSQLLQDKRWLFHDT